MKTWNIKDYEDTSWCPYRDGTKCFHEDTKTGNCNRRDCPIKQTNP